MKYLSMFSSPCADRYATTTLPLPFLSLGPKICMSLRFLHSRENVHLICFLLPVQIDMPPPLHPPFSFKISMSLPQDTAYVEFFLSFSFKIPMSLPQNTVYNRMSFFFSFFLSKSPGGVSQFTPPLRNSSRISTSGLLSDHRGYPMKSVAGDVGQTRGICKWLLAGQCNPRGFPHLACLQFLGGTLGKVCKGMFFYSPLSLCRFQVFRVYRLSFRV